MKFFLLKKRKKFENVKILMSKEVISCSNPETNGEIVGVNPWL